ncbi:MAG: glycosyltransferase family 39 protein [Planctomycetota bacterium]
MLVSVPVLFANLGVPKLWDRDEPRNAGCAEEMLRRGDLVVPMFDDELRTAKPVLTYWLIISAYKVFGVNEFAARFWSAMLAVGTVLATYVIGRRLFEPHVGLWGAIILATSTMFCVAGRAATPDSPLIFCTTVALMIFVVGAFRRNPTQDSTAIADEDAHQADWFPRNWWLVALLYAVMGLGILAKGPVGLVLPTAVIGMFLLIMRLPTQRSPGGLREASDAEEASRLKRAAAFFRSALVQICRVFAPLHFLRTCWSMRPLTAIVTALVVAAPWFILVGLRTEGDFLEAFFLKEHFGRATQAFEGHRGSVLYYPVAILICFFPWSVFAFPTLLDTVARLRQGHPWRSGITFLACWVGVYVGVFSLAQTKLPSYVTPCYPALALLTAGFIYQWLRGAQLAGTVWPRVSLLVLGVVGLGILIGLPIAAFVLLPGEEWLGAIGLIPLIGAIAALVFYRQQQFRQLGTTLAVTATAYVLAVFGVALVRIDSHQENQRLFEAVASHSSNPALASFGCLESSWVFYAKRPIVQLLEVEPRDQPPNAVVGVQKREKPWRPLPKTDVQTFFTENEEPFLITTASHLPKLRASLPADVEVLAEVGYFLKDEKLVVLGRMGNSRNAFNRATEHKLR